MDLRSDCDDSRICDEIEGVVEGIAFYDVYEGNPPTRILAETKSFLLLCDISPIVVGHCLLVPRRHLLSFGHVAQEFESELEEFRDSCESLISESFGPVVTLEHGSSSTMSPSACVTHAHLHLVPNASGVHDVFELDRLQGRAISSWRELSEPAVGDRPYVYFRDPAAGIELLYEQNLSKRHQYLRIAMSEVFGIPEPEWDWAVNIRRDLLRETVERLGISK